MVDHTFGGVWTERKLQCLQKYLEAYRTIFTKNPRARYFNTWYVDAFAGTGSRYTPTSLDPTGLLSDYVDEDAGRYQEGSAKIALGLPNPFHRYLFIEKNSKRVDELQSVIKLDYQQLFERCEFRVGDANSQIQN